MKAIYDKEADAMHIRLKKGKVYKTHEVSPAFIVDTDKKGNVLGIEILDVSSQLSKKEIAKTVHVGKIPISI
jgi:uncharacterized protein YuzE